MQRRHRLRIELGQAAANKPSDNPDEDELSSDEEELSSNGIRTERYTDEEVAELVKLTAKSKKNADSLWKKTGIDKRLKHAAQRIGARATVFQSSYHFAKAVRKVKEIAINEAIRTDNTLDINKFLLEHEATIVERFDKCFFVKKSDRPSGLKKSREDVAEVLSELGNDIEIDLLPGHVAATIDVLADFAKRLHNEVRKKCKKTALTKAQEHWRDRVPLVFAVAAIVFGLKLFNDLRDTGELDFSDINYTTISVITIGFVCSVVFIVLRVGQSIKADALNCAESFYDDFKKNIPTILEQVNNS